MSRDLRQANREELTLFVEYDGVDDMVGDYTENLSAGGTFIATSRDLPIGTEVRLALQFPGLIEPVKITGVVRWKRSEPTGCGLEFTIADERAKLAAAIDRIRARDPNVVRPVYTILIVEDNAHIAGFLQDGLANSRAFADVELHFARATNGAEALTTLRGGAIDAMIIDVYLPVVDGETVIAAVRRELGKPNMPIIAVSGGGNEAKALAIAAGADIYLHKPMRLRQVIETIQSLFVSKGLAT